jgi:GTP-binding protein
MAFTQEQLQLGQKYFAGPISFLKSAPRLEHLPDASVPEVAFAGRSNVGKSSLINALCNRNKLARTSTTPGRTQELNYFDVGQPLAFRLVDMPGYGYAEAPRTLVREWHGLIERFLKGRAVLKRVLVLVDSRHGLKDIDKALMEMLDTAAVSYRVILTKIDKIPARELAVRMKEIGTQLRTHPAAHPELLTTSSEKNKGLEDVRAAICESIFE